MHLEVKNTVIINEVGLTDTPLQINFHPSRHFTHVFFMFHSFFWFVCCNISKPHVHKCRCYHQRSMKIKTAQRDNVPIFKMHDNVVIILGMKPEHAHLPLKKTFLAFKLQLFVNPPMEQLRTATCLPPARGVHVKAGVRSEGPLFE